MTAKLQRAWRYIFIILVCSIFYFISSIPFIDYLRLSETTEVRPYCILPFIFALVFRFPGAAGAAAGNILSDLYYGGIDCAVMALGFSFQIIYGYGGAVIWRFLRRNEDNIFRLDKVEKIVQYLCLVFAISMVLTMMVWSTLHSFYKLEMFGIGFFSTMMNHLIFFVVLGIPFFVGYSCHLQKKRAMAEKMDTYLFSINEKFILFFVLISVIVALLVSAMAYIFLSHYKLYNQTTMWSYIYLISGATLYVCLWPTLIILRIVEKNISRPIEELSSIGQHFGERDDIKSEVEHIENIVENYTSHHSEIGELAVSFRTFSRKLNEYILKVTNFSNQQTKVATQLKIASDIQKGVLPEPLNLAQIDLYADMTPALEVGGDFYDYFMIGEHVLGFVVADVSDKGIPASMFMMVSKTIIQKNMKDGLSPGAALTKSNNELCQNNRTEMFVTVFCGTLNLETGALKYASAGHDHPILSLNSDKFTILKNKTGFVLGEIEDIKYTEKEMVLGSGDIIFVYTDGVPEATNENKEQFGFDRTLDVLNRNREKSMAEMCQALKEAINAFKGNAKPFDDITVMSIRRN